MRTVLALIAAVLAAPTIVHADVRGAFRLGLEPLGLDPSEDTPFIGDHVNDAVRAYNAASTAYNRAHGFAPGSSMASAPIDRTAFGLHTTLVTFAPGLEAGGEHVRFRVEGLIGISDRVRAYGIGVYPLNLSLPLRNNTIAPYLAAGGTLRWLDRTDVGGETGGLATVRVAAGARLGRHIALELGVGLFMLGGLYNGDELASMASYDPRGNAPPPVPDRAVSGGTQSGMVDVSVGFVL